MAPVYTFHPLPDRAADNGAAITALFVSGGPGTTVLLLPSTIYNLLTPVVFSHHRTTLATVGYPTFESGKQAILETRGEKESGAIVMYNFSEVALKRVHVRGCRGWGRRKPENEAEEERLRKLGGMGWVPGGGALVWCGGPGSSDLLIEGCRLEDPRGWTACHVCDWGIRPRVLNNIVGPCGQEASGGPWADGLSIAGKNSVISGNTIIDATDGAIVVFCAPGSTICNNTIIARTRDLLGAINMVDDFPFDRNFAETRVIGNTVRTEGAFIRLGIGCGMTCWSSYQKEHRQNYGGSVLDNMFGPGVMGYAIGLSSVKDFVVRGNVVLPGTSFSGNVARCPGNAPPMAFLTEWKDRRRTPGCDIQDDFVEGEASWLIGVDSGAGERLYYEGGQLRLDAKGISASGEGGIRLLGAKWEVAKGGDLLLREEESEADWGKIGTGKVLWASGKATKAVDNPVLEFSLDGLLTIKADGKTLWDPTEYIRPSLDALAKLAPLKAPAPKEHPDWADHPSVIFSAKTPFLTIRDPIDNVLFASSYEYYQNSWSLLGGQWIAIAPPELRGVVPSQRVPTVEPSSSGAPPIPTSSRPHHFTSFIKDLAADLTAIHPTPGASPPPIPPRRSSPPSPPTFLFLNPLTSQLILHSSPSPAHPAPEYTHFTIPESPSENDSTWFVFQGDGNVVLYAKKGDRIWVPWASGTGGDAQKIVLRGKGEEDGPALEIWGKEGRRMWSSK